MRKPTTRQVYNAILASIEHWKRMRKWVREEIKDGESEVSEYIMTKVLGEGWFDESCPLCTMFDCCYIPIKYPCPIATYYESCNERNSAWDKVYDQTIWEEWLIASDEMMYVLVNLKKRYKRKLMKKSH